MSSSKDFVELNNGRRMPIIGLGTWQGEKDEAIKAIETALEIGYRHIDTAFLYNNEKEVGTAIKNVLAKGKIKREELFVVTKLPVHAMRPEHIQKFLEISLKNLQLDYVDLYLVHRPTGFQYVSENEVFPLQPNGEALIDMNTDLVAIWKKLEEMVDIGLTKSIGVSNYSYEQVERTMKNCRIKPATNQVEYHAYFQQKKLYDFCKKNNVLITAYGPIGSPGLAAGMEKINGVRVEYPRLIADPALKPLSEKYKKTPSQILLRWLTQKGIAVIPKSVNPSRLKENFSILDFELSPEDSAIIDGLDRNLMMFEVNFFKGVDKHPEYKKWVEYS